jgi:hypothetical protein
MVDVIALVLVICLVLAVGAAAGLYAHAVAKRPPAACPRCGETVASRPWTKRGHAWCAKCRTEYGSPATG